MIFPSWMIPWATEEKGGCLILQFPAVHVGLSRVFCGADYFQNKTKSLIQKVSWLWSTLNYPKLSSSRNVDKYIHLEKATVSSHCLRQKTSLH